MMRRVVNPSQRRKACRKDDATFAVHGASGKGGDGSALWYTRKRPLALRNYIPGGTHLRTPLFHCRPPESASFPEFSTAMTSFWLFWLSTELLLFRARRRGLTTFDCSWRCIIGSAWQCLWLCSSLRGSQQHQWGCPLLLGPVLQWCAVLLGRVLSCQCLEECQPVEEPASR